jgi:hypothetical protein
VQIIGLMRVAGATAVLILVLLPALGVALWLDSTDAGRGLRREFKRNHQSG